MCAAISTTAARSADDMLKALREKPPSGDRATVEAYQKVAEACKLPEDEYPYVYANYAMVIPAHSIDPDMSLKAAKECWRLLESKVKSGSFMHFTDIGQFYEEATRICTNCIAWVEGHRTTDPAKLQECVDLVDIGCQFADKESHTYIFDTKVRLLLRMGKKEEAFAVVHHNPNNSELSDIRAEEEYQTWRKMYLERHPIIFSEEEKHFLCAVDKVHKHLLTLLPDRRTRAGVPKGKTSPVPDFAELPDDEDHPLTRDVAYANRFFIARGDVHLKGNVYSDDWSDAVEGADGIIIDGDLVIDGDYYDNGGYELIVKGRFVCDYCYSSDGRICVLGDSDLTHGMYGYYNDGDVEIRGDLRAPYVISADHCMCVTTRDRSKQVYISDNSVSVGDIHEYPLSEHLLNPCVFKNGEDCFDPDLFMECVRRGENPFAEVPSSKKARHE